METIRRPDKILPSGRGYGKRLDVNFPFLEHEQTLAT